MNKNDTWPIMFKNSIVVLAFAILAVKFSKWWIVLFAVFFLSSVTTNTKYYRICDVCGKHGPYAENYNAAIDEAKKAGWTRIKNSNGEWKDICPECQEH